MPTQTRHTTLLGLLAVGGISLWGWRPVNNDDTFMYFATGKWIVDHRAIPQVDPFSWTMHGHTWHTNGWGWGVILWALHCVGGYAAMAMAAPLLTFVVAIGAYLCARQLGARPTVSWVSTILLTVAMTPWVTDRAQMASYAFFPFVMLLAAKAGGQKRIEASWLLLLFATLVVWINVHTSALIALPYIAAYLGGSLLDEWRAASPSQARLFILRSCGVAVVGAFALAATLVNPWGYGIVSNASATRTLSRATISEWYPLYRAGPLALIPVVVALAGIIVFVVMRRNIRMALLLPWIAGAALAEDAIRNAPFFLISSVFLVAPCIPRVRTSLAKRSDLAHVGAITLAICGVAAAVLFVPKTNRPGPGIAAGPIAALPAHCQLRNKSDMGGYILATRPDVPVSADGRNDLYGLSGYAQNDWFTGTRAQAEAGLRTINREGTTCVIARRNSTIVPVLIADHWHIIGEDSGGIGLVRNQS